MTLPAWPDLTVTLVAATGSGTSNAGASDAHEVELVSDMSQ